MYRHRIWGDTRLSTSWTIPSPIGMDSTTLAPPTVVPPSSLPPKPKNPIKAGPPNAKGMREIKLGGMKINVLATPTKLKIQEGPLFPKQDRDKLDKDKLNSLFDKASKSNVKFDFLHLAIDDVDKFRLNDG